VPSTPLIDAHQKMFHLPNFVAPDAEALTDWGFDGVFHLIEENPSWIGWTLLLPRVTTSGQIQWEQTDAVINSLSVLFCALQLDAFPVDIEDVPTQLMSVDVFRLKRDMNAFPLGGSLAPTAVNWIRSRLVDAPRDHVISLSEVEHVMRETFERIAGSIRKGERFSAHLLHPHRLFLGCPGDACELSTSFDEEPVGHGAELNCHNVDTPAQQLAFLMGLAKLHELMRKDGA
jgi:hypothetical protein